MRKMKIAVAILAAVFAFAPMQAHAIAPPPPASSSAAPVGVWLIFGCAGGIILAAAIANGQGRPLTAAEAATCGLLFLLNPPPR